MKNKQVAPKSYSAGKEELEQIHQKLENDQFDIDQLEDLIDRARYLIEYLTTKLRKIEDKLDSSSKN